MNLREPKRKPHVKLKPRPSFPVGISDRNEWITYTAHLTELGSYIEEPDEINAIHSMGFFGKGSLSRSYPMFGKARYGAPPIVRNRQWQRRQSWLTEYNEIRPDSTCSKDLSLETEKHGRSQSSSKDGECKRAQLNTEGKECKISESAIKEINEQYERENTPDIIEVHRNLAPSKGGETKESPGKQETNSQAVNMSFDSTEEDDVCVIVSKEAEEETDKNSEEQEIPKNDKTDKPYGFDNFYFKEDNLYFDEDDHMQGKLLVLPDSDSETEDYLKEIKPKIELEGFPIQETLHLTCEETFFLLYGLGCLNVINFDGSLMNINRAWLYFCKTDKNFVQKYIVYHYFRSKGWVVKPGLKYGGDFLLYKQGPPFYHASYIVIIDVVDADTLIRDPNKSMRNLTWNNLLGLERLSESAAKEILFVQVMWPSSVSRNSNPSNPDVLSEFTVKEVLWRRWTPKQGKDVVDLEEEDDDSS